MIEKWKTQTGFADIERVECTRETKQSVWFMQRKFRFDTPDETVESKASKETDAVRYHDTWALAKAWLKMLAATEVAQARRDLKLAQEFYGKVKSLRSGVDRSPATLPTSRRAGVKPGATQ